MIDRGVVIPMRDGVELMTDIYRPDAPGRFPVILVRTPYGLNSTMILRLASLSPLINSTESLYFAQHPRNFHAVAVFHLKLLGK